MLYPSEGETSLIGDQAVNKICLCQSLYLIILGKVVSFSPLAKKGP